ncbi:MAG: hypothetical protein GXZ09_02615 [Syntrophomonadaceae bacterium]|jgi:hypothetical protein|nr:hypothetical protein [Syntrophomonadaceae bacterium]
MLLKIALVLLLLGLILFAYGAVFYLKISRKLQEIKKEDLVAYYLDLFYELLPRPFWSAVVGLALLILAIITGLAALCFEIAA